MCISDKNIHLFCFQGYLTEALLLRLAYKIGASYFYLGVLLDLGSDLTKTIEKNNRDDAVRCCFEILNTWRQSRENPDSMATYNTLRQALIDLNRNDLAEVLSSGE